MRRIMWSVLVLAAICMPFVARAAGDVSRLSAALRLNDVIALMHDEGLVYGEEIAMSLFPTRSDGAWPAAVERIYDEKKMRAVALPIFERSLAETDLAPLLAFFESPLGRRITDLELSARRAMLDESVDRANAAHVAQLIDEGDPRIDQLRRFIEANDLLEANVQGALNSNYAFMKAMLDGGAYDPSVTQGDILNDVRDQEPSVRSDTEKWLFDFLWLAYSGLSDEELDQYIAVSRTPEGQDMNRALFAGFDTMFDRISAALGAEAARVITAEDL